jgi:hypothetical protein
VGEDAGTIGFFCAGFKSLWIPLVSSAGVGVMAGLWRNSDETGKERGKRKRCLVWVLWWAGSCALLVYGNFLSINQLIIGPDVPLLFLLSANVTICLNEPKVLKTKSLSS